MNKKIAPTVILVIMVILLILQTWGLVYVFSQEGIGIAWKILIIAVPLPIIAALVAVYIERIREIDEQDKDDLSRY